MSSSSLTQFGSLVAPPEIVAALRAIDADADLVHLGGREWLLGVRRPNPEATAEIDKQLRLIDTTALTVVDAVDRYRVQQEIGKEFELLQFFATGFRPIHLYTTTGDGGPGWEIVSDFRTRDFNWRVRAEAAVQELREEISIDVQDAKRTERVREAMRQEGHSIWRHVFGQAKSFVVGITLPKGAT